MARRPARKKAATGKKAAPKKKAAPVKTKAKKAAPKTKARKAAAPAVKRPPALRQTMNKDQLLDSIADSTSISKSQAREVVAHIESLIERSLRPRSVGEFQFPGLLKLQRYTRKATKARIGRNLHTGEPLKIAAKPKRQAVRVKPLKRLRDMVSN